MNEESQNPSIDPELEARIVALVLGEASDAERKELNRLIDQRPELARLQQRFAEVHGLLCDIGTGDFVAQDADDHAWKLSASKRSALLDLMDSEADELVTTQAVIRFDQKRWGQGYVWLRNLAKIAAVLCVAGFIGIMALSGFKASPLAMNAKFTGGSSRKYRFETAPAASAAGFEAYTDSAPSAASSLAGIQDEVRAQFTLPDAHYLDDDVKYFPAGPENKLSAETDALPESRSADRLSRGFQGLQEQEQSIASNAGDSSLAFQADMFGRFGTSDAAKPQETNLSVPEGGEILLGGIRRNRNTQPNLPDRWDDSATSNGEISGLDAMVVDAERRQGQTQSEFGIPELPPVQLRSAGTPDIAALALGQITQGADRPSSGEQASRGGEVHGFYYSVDPTDGRKSDDGLGTREQGFVDAMRSVDAAAMPFEGNQPILYPTADAWESLSRDNAEDRGRASGGIEAQKGRGTFGGVGGEGFETEETRKSELSLAFKPQESAPDNVSLGRGIDAKKDQASQPQVSSGRELKEKQGQVVYDFHAADAPAASPTQLAKEPAVSREAGKRIGQLSDANSESEEVAALSLSLPAVEDLAKPEQTLGQNLTWEVDSNRQYFDKFQAGQSSEASKDIAPDIAPAPNASEFEAWMFKPRSKTVAPAGLNESNAAEAAFSTFSLHVSDVSFKLAQAALARSEWPDAAKVRIEEFVNAFDYGDPMPSQSQAVACRLEQSIHPFLQQRNLLRVSMRTAAAGRSSNTPLRLTFLLDNSGSMERSDRQQTVRRAFSLLAQQLKPIDQVTLISFARQPRLLADRVSGAQSAQLVELIDDLPSEGGTNMEAALQLAFEKAKEQQLEGAQNRIVLLTDGAVNLGDANPESLSQRITSMRDAGIAFDAAGINAEGLNDEILEALTRQGDGRYYLLDSLDTADDGFARQIAGALRPSAKNVKVQIEFNPKRVGNYKLLGFEKHLLKQEDFRNDQVDAAEMAAAEAGVAMYQFEAKPDGEGDVGSVSVRFEDLSTGQMIENRWPIPYEADAPRPEQAAASLRIATSAAMLAAKLRAEPLGESVDLKILSDLMAGLPERDRNTTRVQQLQEMIQQARQLSGN